MKLFFIGCLLTAQVFAEVIDPIACGDKAITARWSKFEASILCSGASSFAPIECAEKAFEGRWAKSEAVLLCSGATSLDPLTCAEKALATGRWTKVHAIQLCQKKALEIF